MGPNPPSLSVDLSLIHCNWLSVKNKRFQSLTSANLYLPATPTAPYDIALLGCDGQSMVLNWKKPLQSGGTAVNAYFVDKRRSGATVWREVHIPAVTERVYQVPSPRPCSGSAHSFKLIMHLAYRFLPIVVIS